jgi:phage-related holin
VINKYISHNVVICVFFQYGWQFIFIIIIIIVVVVVISGVIGVGIGKKIHQRMGSCKNRKIGLIVLIVLFVLFVCVILRDLQKDGHDVI